METNRLFRNSSLASTIADKLRGKSVGTWFDISGLMVNRITSVVLESKG